VLRASSTKEEEEEVEEEEVTAQPSKVKLNPVSFGF
jgi:hypothetical protein